jgi:hypothetical protein
MKDLLSFVLKADERYAFITSSTELEDAPRQIGSIGG